MKKFSWFWMVHCLVCFMFHASIVHSLNETDLFFNSFDFRSHGHKRPQKAPKELKIIQWKIGWWFWFQFAFNRLLTMVNKLFIFWYLPTTIFALSLCSSKNDDFTFIILWLWLWYLYFLLGNVSFKRTKTNRHRSGLSKRRMKHCKRDDSY